MKDIFRSKTIVLYLFGIISLFFYSFTQIDLGLALTRFPVLFTIQRAFQSIGYFQRPLSTLIFISILLVLYFSYILFLNSGRNKKINRRTIWFLIFITAGLLLFSYNAFSHDLFNYIFDAKIFTHYHENPYQHKALDYPGDPMLGFMHWTHRTYPYGPIWLVLTIPLSVISFNIFIFNLFFFKFLAIVSYLGAIYFIEKIAKKIIPGRELTAVILFSFNPLVILESLVSGHNDIVMMCLALWSFSNLIDRKYFSSVILFILSVGVKFVTIFLFPVYSAIIAMQFLKSKIPWFQTNFINVVCMALGVLVASQHSGNFQPWYLLFILPFCAFMVESIYFVTFIIIISFGSALTYVPNLYFGSWDKPVQIMLSYLYTLTLIIAVAVSFLIYLYRSKKRVNRN